MPIRPVCRSWEVTNQAVPSVVPPWAGTGNCMGRKLFHTKGILTYADRRQQRDFKGLENTLKREKQLSVNKDFKKEKRKKKTV